MLTATFQAQSKNTCRPSRCPRPHSQASGKNSELLLALEPRHGRGQPVPRPVVHKLMLFGNSQKMTDNCRRSRHRKLIRFRHAVYDAPYCHTFWRNSASGCRPNKTPEIGYHGNSERFSVPRQSRIRSRGPYRPTRAAGWPSRQPRSRPDREDDPKRTKFLATGTPMPGIICIEARPSDIRSVPGPSSTSRPRAATSRRGDAAASKEISGD